MMKKENKWSLNGKTGAAYRKAYAPIICRPAGKRCGKLAVGCVTIVGEVRSLSFERTDCDGEAT